MSAAMELMLVEQVKIRDAEIATLRSSLAAAEREVERLKVETCKGCQVNIAKQREAEDATMAANRRIVAAERARDEAVAALREVEEAAWNGNSAAAHPLFREKISSICRSVLEGGAK